MGYFLSVLIYREVTGEMVKVLRNKDIGLKSGYSCACPGVRLVCYTIPSSHSYRNCLVK